MTTQRIGKQPLIDQAITLFRAKGYSATSIDDIVKSCGITKGSLYYHFQSKEELALAAMEQVHLHFTTHIFQTILGCAHPDCTNLSAFNQSVENFFMLHPDGCLLANLSLEIGASPALFRDRICAFFREWQSCYLHVLREVYPLLQAELLAEDAIAVVHGALLMYRLNGSLDVLRRGHRRLLSWVENGSV